MLGILLIFCLNVAVCRSVEIDGDVDGNVEVAVLTLIVMLTLVLKFSLLSSLPLPATFLTCFSPSFSPSLPPPLFHCRSYFLGALHMSVFRHGSIFSSVCAREPPLDKLLKTEEAGCGSAFQGNGKPFRSPFRSSRLGGSSSISSGSEGGGGGDGRKKWKYFTHPRSKR